VFCGFSFGAATGLRAACPDQRVAGLISLGTPVSAEGRIYNYHFLESCQRPKLFISGSRDQFGPEQTLKHQVAMAAPPKQLVLIEGADHFFEGRLSQMQAAIHDWVQLNFSHATREAK
jgi:uncharacterized protein